MKLWIDGLSVTAQSEQTLLELVKALGLDNQKFMERPIAAKIAGEVFNLNYIPVRKKDAHAERQSVRRAMAASNGRVTLLRYTDPVGRDVYYRTAQFVLFLALHELWPNDRAIMGCTVGKALYIEVRSPEFSAERLKQKVREIVSRDIPLIRRRVELSEAIAHYQSNGNMDKAKLLAIRTEDYFDQYTYGDFSDYYYGELAPSTGYLQVWDILPVDGGFVFLYPDDNVPHTVAKYEQMPNFLRVCEEGERWCELMDCQNVLI